MTKLASSLVFLLFLSESSTFTPDVLPLPQKRDIPANFSTIICPSRTAAERFLKEFYAVPDPPFNMIDIPLLFRGLAVTGCEQRSGPVEISEVLGRRTLDLGYSENTYVAYRGTRPGGLEVFGLVDETWNDRLPRSPLEAFHQAWTEEGWLSAGRSEYGAEKLVLVCAGPQQARDTIRSLADQARASDKAQNTAFRRAARRHGCRSSPDRFRVSEVHESSWIGCGEECAVEWTSLTGNDEAGRQVGLLFGVETS